MKNGLTNEEIIAKIEQAESQSYGINDAALSEERAKALNYYVGTPFGNEVEGRSQVISRDVLDTIESALPQLLKVFVSGDEVVRFDPRGPNDEAAAEQETAAVNYFTMEKNDGFAVFYTWFKDALLSKNGYVKVWYEEEDETETESYKGLTDDQLTLMLKDDRISVLEHTEYPDEVDAQQRQEALAQMRGNPQAAQQMQAIMAKPPAMLHDVKIEISETRGCIEIDNVAPEDIMVGVDCRTVSLQDASFVQHRVLMDEEEIDEQGWKVDNLGSTYDNQSFNTETNTRDRYGEQDEWNGRDKYLVKDTYIRIDGELKRYVVIGNQIAHEEDAEIIPFATITPHIMPHRHVGMSYSDLTEDIQLIKSTLLRGQLDAMYLANQPRFGISDKVNISDMLTSRPGGLVRVTGSPGEHIMPLVTPTFPTTSFTLMEYLDSSKEKRTGVTAYNQGLDANSLNKTATGVQQIMSAAQERISLVARTFANTGVKELFMLVHRLVRKYYTRPEIIRLRDEWVTVDPREWKERKDMSIAVGLGTGNKDQQLMHLSNLLQQQMAMVQMGLPVITPQNIYETVRQLVMNAGFKQPDQFVTNPQKIPPQPPQQNPLIQVEQIKQQGKQQELQVNAQLEQQKAQAQLQQEQLRSQNDVAIEREKIAAQMQLEKYKADLAAAVDLQKAQLQVEAELQVEQARAQNDAAIQLSQHRTELGSMLEKAKGMQGMDGTNAIMQGLAAIVGSMNRPKTATMPDGRQIQVS